MKKLLAVLLSFVLSLSLCACSNDNATSTNSITRKPGDTPKYILDLDGMDSAFEGVKSSYSKGEMVDISYNLIATDTDYSFTVDGNSFSPDYSNERGFIFRFEMPDHDVKIEINSTNSMVYVPTTDYDTPSVINNNSYFVGKNGKVYFRAPEEGSLYYTALFGSYMNMDSDGSILYEYDPETGDLVKLHEDYHGLGKLAFLGDYIIYTEAVPANVEEEDGGYEEISTHLTIVPTADDNLNFELGPDNQDSLFADKNGHDYISIRYTYQDDAVCTIFVYNSDIGYVKSIDLSDFASAIGIQNGQFIFTSYDKTDNKHYLRQLDLQSENIITLGTLPEPEDYIVLGEIWQVEFTESKVFFGYGFYEGTGHFYANGYIIEATLGEEASLKATPSDSPLTDYEDEEASFIVTDSGFEYSKGPAGKAAVKEDTIGYFDEFGNFIAVATGYGRKHDENDDFVTEIELCELVEDNIYAIRNDLVHMATDDIGWRMAYARSHCEVIKLDIKTGEETVLISLDNDYPPIAYSQLAGTWQLTEYEIEGDGPYYPEKEGTNETFTFNDDFTVDYMFSSNKGQKEQHEGNAVKCVNTNYSFEWEEPNGPTRVYPYSMDENGNLYMTMVFYYGDGTTASRSGKYTKIK